MNKHEGLPKSQRPTIKVILVGNSGVGKTCLISSYFRQSFDFQAIPTVAPAYSCSDVKRPDGTIISLQIWDTAGQERYHSVSKLFFRDSDVAFVCFEIGQPESLKEVPNWIKRVRDEVPNCEVLFVITKSDLHSKEDIQKYKLDVEDQLKEFNHKGIFITSSLLREGVQELFTQSAELFKGKITSNKNPNTAVKDESKSRPCC